jgi:hypothetical protein
MYTKRKYFIRLWIVSGTVGLAASVRASIRTGKKTIFPSRSSPNQYRLMDGRDLDLST